MSLRKIAFVENEFYHIYNRGVDRRSIFSGKDDLKRFFQSMSEFNTIKPIGSIYEHSFNKDIKDNLPNPPLIQFVAYCLNPNHFHFIITQLEERGIEKFMHRLGTGYTKYFNEKHSRSGALFQGRFKANHINSNEYLLHASVYVNLNYQVHKLKSDKNLFLSSWNEYEDENETNHGICSKEIILDQFKSIKRYKEFTEKTLEDILKKRADIVIELENMAKNKHLEVELPS
ncbi:MAG: transposase [Candidatus Zambryskibacteria bacterium]|nr:transposase [Candidatus Zambryskibacteria bacterium]